MTTAPFGRSGGGSTLRRVTARVLAAQPSSAEPTGAVDTRPALVDPYPSRYTTGRSGRRRRPARQEQGVPAGCGEIHRRWGRLPWQQVVEPAVSLARSGVALPAEQARTLVSVAPAMVPGAGAAIYSPGGKLLEGGDLLFHPGLDTALAA